MTLQVAAEGGWKPCRCAIQALSCDGKHVVGFGKGAAGGLQPEFPVLQDAGDSAALAGQE